MRLPPSSHLIRKKINKTSFILKSNLGSFLGKCFSFSFPNFSFSHLLSGFIYALVGFGVYFLCLGQERVHRATVLKERRESVLGERKKKSHAKILHEKMGSLQSSSQQGTFLVLGWGGVCY